MKTTTGRWLFRVAACGVALAAAIVAHRVDAWQAPAGEAASSAAAATDADPGAARFHAAAGRALDVMVKEAETRGMKGVAVVAWVPGDKTLAWDSKMRAVDAIVLGEANVLAIAYAKLSEMADTLRDSGSQARKTLHGELGYRGGAIRPTAGGFYLAAFSGGKDTDDLDVSRKGLDALEAKPDGAPAGK